MFCHRSIPKVGASKQICTIQSFRKRLVCNNVASRQRGHGPERDVGMLGAESGPTAQLQRSGRHVNDEQRTISEAQSMKQSKSAMQ